MYPIRTHSCPIQSDSKPVVLTIGGSDSAGLAGIQMDIRCMQSFGVHAATVITAVTAQNNQGLYALNPVPSDVLAQQIDAAMVLQPQAIKIGMLASDAQVDFLCDKLGSLDIPIIFDPVMATSSKAQTVDATLAATIKSHLLPLCTVITPNLQEATRLSGIDIVNDQARTQAASALKASDVDWVVIKGGHAIRSHADDYCIGPAHEFVLSQPKIDTENLRGTGCAFASFVASAIALGFEIRDALVLAKMAMHSGIVYAKAVNKEIGAVEPIGFPSAYWPVYHDSLLPPTSHSLSFPSCVGDGYPDDLGLYPIVDSVDWLSRLLPRGISTAQLRIKHLTGEALAEEIASAVALAKQYHCRLFINDHWQVAIDKGAYGVHLGQEDIHTADLKAISEAGLRLGLSNHCHYEIIRSLAIKASYIACGPIFATTTKDMSWVPHGIAGLRYWTQSLPKDIPLVCIGGIDENTISDLASTGVSGIALITAITQDADPEQKLTQLMAMMISSREKI